MIAHLMGLDANQEFVQPFDGSWDDEEYQYQAQGDGTEPIQELALDSPFCVNSPVQTDPSDPAPFSPERLLMQSRPEVVGPPILTLSGWVPPGRGWTGPVSGEVLKGEDGQGLLPPTERKWVARKKNQVRKGDGPDSQPDPAGRDNYRYEDGYFYQRLRDMIQKAPAKVVIAFCKAVMRASPAGLSPTNRWVTRRVPCAYGWLDENRMFISEEVVEECIGSLRMSGLLR
jgi:hypothetical protein